MNLPHLNILQALSGNPDASSSSGDSSSGNEAASSRAESIRRHKHKKHKKAEKHPGFPRRRRKQYDSSASEASRLGCMGGDVVSWRLHVQVDVV